MKARLIMLFCILFTAINLFSQSVSINTTGTAADTSAILDISSSSKGFLMPRMTQSQRLGIVLPADGLLIFQADSVKGFYYYHSSTGWTLLASGSEVISSFNGITSVAQSFGTPGTSGTSPNWLSSGSVHTLNIPMSGTSGVNAGLLSNTDWNIFNNKLSSVDTGNIPNFYLKVRSRLSAGSGISYNSTTGIIGNSGVLSLNGNTGALTIDTGYITNYYQKVRGLFSGSAPITLTNGQIGITQSDSGSNGYLSSTDWNTFNNKLSTTTGWTTTGNTGSVAGTNFIGTTDTIDLVTKTNSTERMRILSGGNVGIGTNAPGSSLDVKGTLRLSGSTSGYVGLQPAAAAGSTTYILPLADGSSGQQLTTNGSGTLSWSNQTGSTSVSNTSSANNLSTTVNSITGSPVNIINSNATSLSGTNLTTTVNGVAAAALDLTPAISAATTHTVGTAGTNILTSTVNGVTDTSLSVNVVSNSISTNSLTTTVNGVAGTALDLSASLWSKTGNAGTLAVTNFIGTTDAIDFVAKTNNTERFRISSAGNVGINTTGPTNKLHVNGNARITVMAGGLDTDSLMTVGSTGVINKRTVANVLAGGTTNTLGSSVNTITSTINGVAANAPAVNSVANTSSVNNMTTTVNGVAGSSVRIINSNATSLSGNNLTTTVNGVAATALDLSPIVAANGWSKTGNSGTTAGTNFVGTTDAIDFVTKTNNTEKMRVTSSGNVGIGTNAPGSALDVKGTLRLSGSTSGYIGLTAAAAAGSTTYTLPSADGVSGQALLTNGSGILSWGANRCSLGTIGAGFTIPGTATGTYYCTGSYITLPPGKYIVSVNMMLAGTLNQSSLQPGSFFLKSFFADVSFGTTAGTTMSPALPATNVTSDVVGNAKLISGSISIGQPYNPLTGFVVINNTSGANKSYYYWMGWVALTNVTAGTSSLSLVGGTNYGEDNIVAFPAN